MNTFYITTPIYYANDVAHIGHAYTTIMADIIARANRQRGIETYFLTGTDEHGQKILNAAKNLNLPVKEFTDKISISWINLWKKLEISNDFFIRTTDKNHEKTVSKIVEKLYLQGDIYKGNYSGIYCVACETFYKEKELVNNLCPIHKIKTEHVSEESYFFKLSKYQNQILEYLESDKTILPKNKKSQIINRVKEGLNDISMSRTSFDWGVKFPFDDKHVVYVWFDALINYISAIGYENNLDSKLFKKFWPANIHLIGKEILWFHSVIWPGILFALNLDPPKIVFAHGWWTVDGQKMSKTTGNIVDPIKMVEKYGLDPFRYFLVRGCSFGEDGDFSERALKESLNNELANELGNLVNRVLKLITKFSDSKIPKNSGVQTDSDKELIKSIQIKNKLFKAFDELNLNEALGLIWGVIKSSNRYMNETEPWKLEQTDKARFNDILYNAVESIRLIAILINPILPQTSREIFRQLNIPQQDYSKYKFGLLKPGHNIDCPKILFQKID
jgi:methionyl-tRNA synthetase